LKTLSRRVCRGREGGRGENSKGWRKRCRHNGP
jgi:hypothetical protein